VGARSGPKLAKSHREIDMPEIGVTLAFAEIYDGVEFPA